MQNIHPEEIYDYMNNIVSFDKAKKLNNICIAHCSCHITTEIDDHNPNSSCHCFKCRVCRVLLCVLTERKQEKLFLLVNKNNYKYISDFTLCNNILIWDWLTKRSWFFLAASLTSIVTNWRIMDTSQFKTIVYFIAHSDKTIVEFKHFCVSLHSQAGCS